MISVLFSKTFYVNSPVLEQHLDSVMEALLELENERLDDSDISATLATGEVSISVVAKSENTDDSKALGEAVSLADSAIRSAIHKAGGVTLGWEEIATHMEQLDLALKV